MAIHNFAAIDLGASSGRVILATTSEGKINLEEIHRFSDPIIEMQGHFYWDFPAIYKSVIEGLARWFEYDWCLRRQDDNKINNKIANWYIEELHHEFDNFLYPQWPYAAAKVIIQYGPTSWFFASEIIKITLNSKEDHWKKAYEFLVRYDIPITQHQ